MRLRLTLLRLSLCSFAGRCLSTRASPSALPAPHPLFQAHLSTVGFTAGFGDPDLLRTGASQATDIYSLGATVRHVAHAAACEGEAGAEAFAAQLCAPSPAQRPSAVQCLQSAFFAPVYAWERRQRRACCVAASEGCAEGECEPREGLECGGDPAHFVCHYCLNALVLDFASPGQSRKWQRCDGRVFCPMHPTECSAGPWSDWQLARALASHVFEAYTQARRQLLETTFAQTVDQEVKAQVAVEVQRLAALGEQRATIMRARRHVEEEIMNCRCPRCSAVFTDFTGCLALACARCPAHFCGWCLADCGNDRESAHGHVQRCPQRPSGTTDDLFAPFTKFEEHHQRRRRRQASEYLREFDAEVRETVLREVGLPREVGLTTQGLDRRGVSPPPARQVG